GLRAHPPRRDPFGGRRGIHELRRLGGVLHGADRASRWQRPALPPGRRPEPGRRACTVRAGGMRILIVSDAWLPQVNGVVTSLRALVAELRELGHLVKVLSPQDFRHLPCPSYPEIPLAWDLWNVGPAIREFRPDCVHLATEGPLGWAARRWLRRRGLAFSSAIHTRFPEYVHTRWPRIPLSWGYAFLRRFHRPSRAVLVTTERLRAEFAGHGLRHLSLWRKGVDTGLFRPAGEAPDEPVFLYVGRLAA